MEEYNNLYGTEPHPLPVNATASQKEETVYTRKEQITAFLSMLAGFLFIRFGMYHVTGLLTTIFFCLLFTLCIVYLKKNGKVLHSSHKLLAAVLYAFSLVYTITANTFLKNLNTVFLLLVTALFVYLVCHPDGGVFRWLPYSMQNAVLAQPFGSFGRCPEAAVSTVKGTAGWRNVLYILGGLAAAIPLTGIVAALLCSADEGMSELLGNLILTPDAETLTLIPHLAFGVLGGFWIFGMLYGNVFRKSSDSDLNYIQKVQAMRTMPNPMVYAMVTPICILYVLFFISQFPYFLGGFTGDLAEGFTYAEYARKGFFELCWVCCINAAVIAGMSFLPKHSGEQKPILLKLYTIFLAGSSLILAGTALAKMFLYIDNYGMTQLRIYTTWFMLLLMLVFLLVIIRQFKVNLPVCKIGFAVFTVMFGLLCFSRPDAWMTRYNAEMYLAGELEEFDGEMIRCELSDDAVAVLCTYPAGVLSEDPDDPYTAEHTIRASRVAHDLDFYTMLNLSAWLIEANGVAE